MEEIKLYLKEAGEDAVRIAWNRIDGDDEAGGTVYEVYWSDRCTPGMQYKQAARTTETDLDPSVSSCGGEKRPGRTDGRKKRHPENAGEKGMEPPA